MAEFSRKKIINKNATNNVNNSDEPWKISARTAKYDKNGDFNVILSSFKYEDMPKANKLGTGIFSIQLDYNKNIWLKIKKDKINEFLGIIDSFKLFLLNTNNYKEEFVDTFIEKLRLYIETTPNIEEETENERKIATTWKELLKQLEDPELRKKFLIFQTTYTCQHSIPDAVLSRSNVAEVLNADPQATFVTNAHCWLRDFNRRVLPNAPFVIINRIENSINRKLIDKDPKVIENGGWDNVRKNSRGAAYGDAFSAIKRANRQTSNHYYRREKVYDVRYTVPIDPNKDPFMDIPNLLNNLTGEINDAAKEYFQQKDAEVGVKKDYDAKKEGLVDNELEMYKEFILKKCKYKNINISDVGDINDVIYKGIYEYCYKVAEDYNFLHPKNKEIFASAVAISVASTMNIQSKNIPRAFQVFSSLNKEDAEKIIMSTFRVYKSLVNFKINESINESGVNVMNFDEYRKNLMKLFSQSLKESFQNKFKNLIERMNKC